MEQWNGGEGGVSVAVGGGDEARTASFSDRELTTPPFFIKHLTPS